MPNLVLTARELKLLASGVSLESIITSRYLVATDVALDPHTLNRYFADQLSVGELYQSHFVMGTISDSISTGDSDPLFALDLLKTDSVSFADTESIVMEYNRSFADAFALDDNATVDALVKDYFGNKGNVFGFSDTQAFGVGKVLADSFSMAEGIDSFGIGKGLSDTQTLTDSFDRAVTYIRGFADAFTLDDAATVDALKKNTESVKGNIFGFNDVFGRVVAYNRTFADTFSPSESHAVTFTKSADADTFTFADSLSRTVSYVRAHSDSYSFSDTDVYSFGKGLSDTQTITESHASSTSLGKTDTFSVTESSSSSVGKAPSDSFSFSDSESRVVQFSRTFSDAFALDDSATVDALVKDTTNVKTNVFSFADTQAFGVSKGATDSFSFADAVDSISVGKGASDSVTMADNFSYALFSNAAMNAAQLNVSPFNQ